MPLAKNKTANCPVSTDVDGAAVLARWLEPCNPGEDIFTAKQWRTIVQALELSDREREVTLLIVEGCSRGEIAARLHKTDGSRLSEQTVRVYVERIYQKARVQDRLALVLRLARICRDDDDAPQGASPAARSRRQRKS